MNHEPKQSHHLTSLASQVTASGLFLNWSGGWDHKSLGYMYVREMGELASIGCRYQNSNPYGFKGKKNHKQKTINSHSLLQIAAQAQTGGKSRPQRGTHFLLSVPAVCPYASPVLRPMIALQSSQKVWDCTLLGDSAVEEGAAVF